jgi:hypothetical protein
LKDQQNRAGKRKAKQAANGFGEPMQWLYQQEGLQRVI